MSTSHRAAELLPRLVESAACAGLGPTPEQLATALRWGVRAAEAGHPVWLPLLLDAAASLLPAAPRGRGVTWRQSDPGQAGDGCTCAAEHDRLVARVIELARRVGLTTGRSSPDHPDYLPFLLWWLPSANGAEPASWSAAYAQLQGHTAQVRQRLDGARDLRGTAWHWHVPATAPAQAPAEPALWSQFASDHGAGWLHQQVDHMAAEVYLRAGSRPLSTQQQSRIQRLLHRRTAAVHDPMTTSYEDLDPYHGAVSLAILALEEYGEYKLLNPPAVFISDPPATQPPSLVRLHLCWANGYTGLCERTALHLPAPTSFAPATTATPASDSQGDGAAAATTLVACCAGSLLPGMVGVLLDDWRSALQALPVSFHLHGGNGQEDGLALGRGGPRWHDPHRPFTAPPSGVVGRLFRRRSHVDLALPNGWSLPASRAGQVADWHCGVVLEADLGDLGLAATTRQGLGGGPTRLLEGTAEALPACLEHLLVLAPGRAASGIWSVRRHGAGVTLWPLGFQDKDPYPYLHLRRRALDLVLGVLEARMS